MISFQCHTRRLPQPRPVAGGAAGHRGQEPLQRVQEAAEGDGLQAQDGARPPHLHPARARLVLHERSHDPRARGQIRQGRPARQHL